MTVHQVFCTAPVPPAGSYTTLLQDDTAYAHMRQLEHRAPKTAKLTNGYRGEPIPAGEASLGWLRGGGSHWRVSTVVVQ